MKKNLETYLKSEVEAVQHLDESVVSIGETDSFKGDEYTGPHRHEYILWDPNTGWGKTSGPIDEPDGKVRLNAGVHEHMIVDGKVLEVAGHTHELKKPVYTGDHSRYTPQAVQVKEVDD